MGGNMPKMSFFQYRLGMGYGVRKMTARVWRVFLLLIRPSPTLIHRDIGPYVGQNDQKSSKIFVFGYETWGVQSNGHIVGIIFGNRID